MLAQLLAADTALFLWINQMLSNSALDIIFQLLTYLGSVWLWIPVSLIVLYYRKPLGRRLVFGLISANLVAYALKAIVARPRPFDALSGVHVLENEAFGSFPSGHATNAFLMAFLLAQAYPKYKWAFYSLAVVVAFSRVYLGVHYPLDVLAGAALGLAAGYAVVKLLPEKKRKQ
jgi:undecaprenyl-diphosphatase